jgi:hypothetical protein
MNRVAARLLTRLYPRAWRERYGEEFEAFLQDSHGGLRTSVNVLWSALSERIFPTRGGNMDQQINSFGAIIKRPSAFLPLAMSLTALTMLLGFIARYWVVHGTYMIAREPDEGAVAHLWQLLMGGQMPIIAFFAIKWLPKAPRQTMRVLALHIGAALASMAPVFLLNL